MKTGKRFLSIFLVVLMLLTAAPLAGFVGLEFAPRVKAYSVGDHIQFGTYPQTKVAETTALKNAANAAVWKSYDYYTGTGSLTDGNMHPGNYMQFADFFVGKEKYRAVTFSAYRPDSTGLRSSTTNTRQDDNGYTPNNTYYFKYEPLTWRILDPSTGYIMCENIIDSQAYQNTNYSANGERWQAIGSSVYANDYATSSIRDWLNYDFYETAFTASQKENIKTTALNNDAYSSSGSQYNSPTTNDKIFLLSWADALNTSYGFSSSNSTNDTARRAQGTDYAKCQGLWVKTRYDYIGNSWWWLRSPGDNSGSACYVYYYGNASSHGVDRTDGGVRPACKLSNLRSDISQSETLFSEGGSSVEVPVEPDWDEAYSGFDPSIDGNGFWHGPYTKIDSGFYDVTSRQMSAKFYSQLLSHSTLSMQVIVPFLANLPFKVLYGNRNPGWCFGIAATMGLLFENYIELEDLSNQTNAANYYSLGKPCEDALFLDNLNYYYLLQDAAPGFGDNKAANARTVRSDIYKGLSNPFLNTSSYQYFFKTLIDYLATGRVAVLCNGGHAMLATGVRYDRAKKEYHVQIFDENSKDSPDPGEFSEIIVSSDYSRFTANGKNDSNGQNEENYSEFTFFDMSKFERYIVTKDTLTILSAAVSQISDHTILMMHDNMKVFGSSGNNQFDLEYKDGCFSGNMPLYDLHYSLDGNENQKSVFVEIPEYDSYTITSETGNNSFMLCNNNRLFALDVDDVDSVVVDMKTGMDLFGDSYSFNATVSTDEKVVETQNGLISVSGKANGNTHIGKDSDIIQLSSDELIENVKGTTYLGLTKEENEYGNVDSLQIKAEKETAHQLDEFEIVEKATCTEDGLKKGICSKCLKEVEEPIPATGTHTYTSTVTTEPICIKPGETTYTCSVCGDTYTEPIPATGNHVDDNNDGKCDTCGEKMTGGKHCKYCGKIHGGAFGWLTKFFHSILAIFKR